jgi:two-component system, OmpR family, sensor histidine kinase KdpD
VRLDAICGRFVDQYAEIRARKYAFFTPLPGPLLRVRDIMPRMISRIPPSRFRYRVLVYAAAACATTTGVAALLLRILDLSNVVMLFLMTVMLVALRWGRAAGALAAVLAVGSFDFFFVPPVWSFQVSDTQYLFTFFLMLVVAMISGQLAARLRAEAMTAAAGEHRANALAAVATDLSIAVRNEDIADVCVARIGPLFDSRAKLLVPGLDEHVVSENPRDRGIAQWVLEQGLSAGRGTEVLPDSAATYLPLTTRLRTRGVLMLERDAPEPLNAEQLGLLGAFQSLLAQAIERMHFVEVAHETQLRMEGERLRNTLLSAVSHDLRTPLTAIRGMAGMLGEGDVARAIINQADRMQRHVANLLDAARMQAEGVHLDLQWHALDELVGSALAATELGARRIDVDIPPDIPLVELDATLFEHVLVNLLDNATKYTPDDAMIAISAEQTEAQVTLRIEDDGPGFPANVDPHALFAQFVRGARDSSVPGVGLGLSLSRRIVEAHGGSISAARREPRGACFEIILAAHEPPPIDLEEPA